jgi:hypothetical protein
VHGHHQAQTIRDCAAAATGIPALHIPAFPGPLMVASHVLAVAVTVLLLTHGETVLWRMLAWLAPWVIELRPSVLPQGKAPAPLRSSWVPRLHPWLRIRLVRGPPAYSPGPVSV